MHKVKKNIEEAFQKHYIKEVEAALLYQNMSSWCMRNGFLGHAKFLRAHSQEEYGHSIKFHEYLSNRGVAPFLSGVDFDDCLKKKEWKDPIQMFEEIAKHEYSTTSSIHELNTLAEKEKDYVAKNFLKQFVDEQFEEEQLFDGILEMYKLLKNSNEKYFLVDQKLASKKH